MNNKKLEQIPFEEYKLSVEAELMHYLVDGTFDKFNLNTVCDISIDTEHEGLNPAEEASRLMHKELSDIDGGKWYLGLRRASIIANGIIELIKVEDEDFSDGEKMDEILDTLSTELLIDGCDINDSEVTNRRIVVGKSTSFPLITSTIRLGVMSTVDTLTDSEWLEMISSAMEDYVKISKDEMKRGK